MCKALCGQIANELGAAHKYLAMAYSFESMGLKILAKRFMKQSDEEREHALKIAKFVHDVGGSVTLEAIDKPKGDYSSAKAIVKAALDSEMTVTGQINDLVTMAKKENDYATENFLQWFVEEQVEEVSSMTELLQLVSMAGEANLLALENRLAATMGD